MQTLFISRPNLHILLGLPMTSTAIMEAVDGSEPHHPRTRAQYLAHVKATIRAAGYTPVPAVYDEAGNCRICGECGRCPGWHTTEEAGQ